MRAVNLLPPDRRKGAKGEKSAPKLTKLHGIGLGVVLVGGALAYWGHGIAAKAADQKAQADASEAQAQTLQTQISTEKAKAEAKPKQSNFESEKLLVTGLAQARINWSTVILNLSRVAPQTVYLEKISVETPSAASGAGTAAAMPTAITLIAHAKTRTAAVQYIARLDGLPGFEEPSLKGGIDPEEGKPGYKFEVEIPINDGIFGPNKPSQATAASTGSTTTSSTSTTSTPATAPAQAPSTTSTPTNR